MGRGTDIHEVSRNKAAQAMHERWTRDADHVDCGARRDREHGQGSYREIKEQGAVSAISLGEGWTDDADMQQPSSASERALLRTGIHIVCRGIEEGKVMQKRKYGGHKADSSLSVTSKDRSYLISVPVVKTRDRPEPAHRA